MMIQPPLHMPLAGTSPQRSNGASPASRSRDSSPVEGDPRGGEPPPDGNEESVFLFRATPAQRRFWLLDQLHPGGNPALNMLLALHWRGPLDQATLHRAFEHILARHEALRTTFGHEQGELHQLIRAKLAFDLPLIEAPQDTPAGFAEVAAEIARNEASRPLDLRNGPLLRARLVRFRPNEHVLLITVHHIVSDGWSNGILIRDLWEAYTSMLNGEAPSLPELTIQFADYAEWQEAQLAAGDFDEQRDYWRQQLAGELPALDLPFDRARRSAPNIAGAIRARQLPLGLVQKVREVAAGENVSTFMIFFAAFQVLLHRYTRQHDFLVTAPNANRDHPDFERVVGLFVNPLLLRADTHGDPSVRDLLASVRGVTLGAFANADVPFESLLDEFRGSRLQANFHYEANAPQQPVLPPGVTVELLPSVSAGTVYEISLSAFEKPDGARLEIEYNTSLFDAATIDRMLGHYETLLTAVVTEPATRISRLPLLTGDERRDLGLDSAKSAAAHRPRLDVRAPLIDRVMIKPDSVFARHGRRELSCAELLARMERSARSAPDAASAPSDLDHAAEWVAHWRARVETPPAEVAARTAEVEAAVSAACVQLRDFAGLNAADRVASSTPAGAAAAEEIGAVILAGALLVYPTPGLVAGPTTALLAWLEAEEVTVACLPAETWNRLSAAISTRKARRPPKLRLVVATEGEPHAGSFGRARKNGDSGIRVGVRTVLDAADGTIALDGRLLPRVRGRFQILDPESHEPVPIGVPGELCIAESERAPVSIGELAKWLPDEGIVRLGTVEHQHYVCGSRLDTRLVEDALVGLPGIEHALVRCSEGAAESRLVAYVLPTPTAGSLPPQTVLRQMLRGHSVPDHLLPTAFITLKDVPIDTHGRFDPTGLRPPAVDRPGQPSEPIRPYLGLQLQLIAIWEDVLGVRGIGIRDDFFELGGHSLLAMRMLQRAEHACGKLILPTSLFRNPTVERLAEAIAREVNDDAPNILRVNESGTRTPLFYLHGDLSGGGFYSLKLSRALGDDQPVYVLPPVDIRRLPTAPTIEQMAEQHLQAVRAIRPTGPYVIGGFCIGGLVAFELAQQIESAGDVVEMLVMIDAAPETRSLRGLRFGAGAVGSILRREDRATVAMFGRWTVWQARLARWAGLGLGTQTRIAARRLYRRLAHTGRAATGLFRSRSHSRDGASAENKAAAETAHDVPSTFLWASAKYRPKPYNGRVALLLSNDVAKGPDILADEWRSLAPALTVHPLTGSHLECITAHVGSLAQTIEACLTAGSTEGVAALRPEAQNVR